VFTETTGWRRNYEVKAQLDGYDPLITNVRQESWNTPIVLFSTIPLIGGCVFAPLGLFWSRQLPDRIVFVLENDTDLRLPETDSEFDY